MNDTLILVISIAAGVAVAGLMAWKLKKNCVP